MNIGTKMGASPLGGGAGDQQVHRAGEEHEGDHEEDRLILQTEAADQSSALDRDDGAEVGPVEERDELRGEERHHEVRPHGRHRGVHALGDIVVAAHGAGREAVGEAGDEAREKDERGQATDEEALEEVGGIARIAQETLPRTAHGQAAPDRDRRERE
jgi:hypothetical protein